MSRILIIEDELALLESLTILIETNGFETIGFSTAAAGIDYLKVPGNDIGLIICDINLPDINGYEVLKIVRGDPRLYSIPFVFLTAYADEKDVRIGMNLGADDYLTKPFSMRELIKTINARLVLQKGINDRRETEMNNKWASVINTSFRQEFYTPVNILLNAASLLNNPDFELDRDKMTDIMAGIYQTAFRMYRSSRNMVLYGLLVSGQEIMSDTQMYSSNITSILLDVLHYYKPEGIEANSSVDCMIEDVTILNYDKEFINIIFTELIDNAIKFNIGANRPSVVLQPHGDGFSFSVTNYLDPSVTVALSDIAPFKKFHNDISFTGLGMGLYVCRSLCDLLGFTFIIKQSSGRITFSVSHV